VKVRVIARSTFGIFLHNKVIFVVCLIFVCNFLIGLYAVLSFKSMTTASNAQQMQTLMLDDVGKVMWLLRNHARTSSQLWLDSVVPLGQSFMTLQSK